MRFELSYDYVQGVLVFCNAGHDTDVCFRWSKLEDAAWCNIHVSIASPATPPPPAPKANSGGDENVHRGQTSPVALVISRTVRAQTSEY